MPCFISRRPRRGAVSPVEDRRLRSLLVVSAHSDIQLSEALESGADALIIDLDGGVAPGADFVAFRRRRARGARRLGCSRARARSIAVGSTTTSRP